MDATFYFARDSEGFRKIVSFLGPTSFSNLRNCSTSLRSLCDDVERAVVARPDRWTIERTFHESYFLKDDNDCRSYTRLQKALAFGNTIVPRVLYSEMLMDSVLEQLMIVIPRNRLFCEAAEFSGCVTAPVFRRFAEMFKIQDVIWTNSLHPSFFERPLPPYMTQLGDHCSSKRAPLPFGAKSLRGCQVEISYFSYWDEATVMDWNEVIAIIETVAASSHGLVKWHFF